MKMNIYLKKTVYAIHQFQLEFMTFHNKMHANRVLFLSLPISLCMNESIFLLFVWCAVFSAH